MSNVEFIAPGMNTGVISRTKNCPYLEMFLIRANLVLMRSSYLIFVGSTSGI